MHRLFCLLGYQRVQKLGNVYVQYIDNLVIGVVDNIILQKLCRHLQFNEEASQISPFLQFGDPLEQPVEDGVGHGLAASHQTLSKAAPA